MPEDGRHIVGVSGVVCDGEGRILLIRTEKAGWELPGGRVEQGEDFIAALEREVLEETGCEVEVGRLTGVTSNAGAPSLAIFTFLCRHTRGDAHPGDDSLEAGWFAPDTAVGLITHPVEQVRLRDALREGHGVSYRAYRRLPGDGQQGERYEMLRLHRC
jgi:ADP-ribose pyrophosphatase YjhB (NUDIX family)